MDACKKDFCSLCLQLGNFGLRRQESALQPTQAVKPCLACPEAHAAL